MGTEMLHCAQHDSPGFGCYISLSRQGQSGGATQAQVGHAPTPRRDKSRSLDKSGTYNAPMITSADL